MKLFRRYVAVMCVAAVISANCHAHKIEQTECSALAQDAERIAEKRDRGFPIDTQKAQALALLSFCHEQGKNYCFYQDAEDDSIMYHMIDLAYAEPGASLDPTAFSVRVFNGCRGLRREQ
jgi:hypothetical protein